MNGQKVMVVDKNTAFIHDEHEYEALKKALAAGKRLCSPDIERLAFTLGDYCVRHAAEDEDLETAGREISLLFQCRQALPDSKAVRDALYEAALMYIDEAGDQDLKRAEACLSQLLALLEQDSANRTLARVCANASILTLVNYLDRDEAAEKKSLFSFRRKKTPREHALDRYATLEALAAPCLDRDPVMPAMLAWARRAFIVDDVFAGRADLCAAGLRELAGFAGKYPDNVWVAAEYVHACCRCFQNRFRDLPRAEAEELLSEIERVVRAYNVKYDAIAESDPDYVFPGYDPGKIDDYFISALTDFAVHETENNHADGIWAIFNRLSGMTCSPGAVKMYRVAQGQLFSNLVFVYGNGGDHARAGEAIGKLRELAHAEQGRDISGKALTESLSDALYNLITDFAEADAVRHKERLDDLIAELKELADGADEAHSHIRYAAALYNVCANGPEDKALRERLYTYVLEHDTGGSVAEKVAEGESILVAKAGKTGGIENAKHHWRRVKALAACGYYSRVSEIQAQSAVADFNLLTVASDAGDMALAGEMFASMVETAAACPENAAVALRLAKGALNLVTDHGEAGDIAKAEAVFHTMLPHALPFSDDPEIAKRVVNAAFNLSIDLVNAGQHQRVAPIYDAIQHIKPDGEALSRLDKIRTMSGRK
ncbi:MAG: hypothetical protein LBS49_14165 [Candidatus Accumulibacter sp.]|nr:hypothetical protein [Accumulibacter sp.]